MSDQKRILKTALSYLQRCEGLSYENALGKISKIIATGAHGDNPVFGHLIEANLPSNPDQLHQIMTPSAIHG